MAKLAVADSEPDGARLGESSDYGLAGFGRTPAVVEVDFNRREWLNGVDGYLNIVPPLVLS